MKFVLGCTIVAVAMTAIAESQPRDPFTGSWKINRAKSKQQTGEPPLSEDITIRVEDGVEHYTVDVKNPDGTASKNAYDAKYNDGQWHAYINRTSGETTSQLMMVKVDPRTEYRFMKNKDGKSTGVLMRRMSDDERSYASIMMTTAGEISLVRIFERQ